MIARASDAIPRFRRLADVLVGTGFRAAPRTAVWCLLLGVAAAVCSVTYTLGLKVTIDGAIARSDSQVALGAALVAVLFCASWLLAVIGGSESSVLTDKSNLALGVRIARMVAALPTLHHFEDPELLRRVETVTGGRRTLAGAPRQLIGLSGQALRAIGMVVLLALIYPPVLVVPLLALAPALADRRAGRVQKRGPIRSSPRTVGCCPRCSSWPRRPATPASCAPTTSPMLSPRRHAALAERVRRRAVRAAVVSALWEGVGWLVFAAGPRGGDRRCSCCAPLTAT